MRRRYKTPKSSVRNGLQAPHVSPEQPSTNRPTRTRGRKRINYPASLSPSIVEIAKAAGFFDGEGHVTSKNNHIVVQINQNDKETLTWLSDRFGGRIYGPYVKKATGNLYHYWMFSGPRALGFMFTIFKFLPEDRKQQFKAALTGKPQRRIYRKAFTPDGVDEAYISYKLKQLWRKRDRENKKLKGMQIFGVKR